MSAILFAAAFLISAAAATGIGGGGLFTLCLSAFSGLTQFRAQGVNLFVFVFAAVPATVYHARKNGADLKIAAYLSFCGCTGCLIGSLLAAGAEQKTLRTAFGVFSLTAGLISIVKQTAEKRKRRIENGE